MLGVSSKFCFRISSPAERIALWLVIFLLILSNIVTVTNSTFQQSVFVLLSHVPFEGLLKNSVVANNKLLELENKSLRQQYQQLNNKWESHKTKANAVSKSVIKRSARNAAKNVSSLIGEAIPYLGTALIISVTVDDVTDSCNTIREMNELATFFEMETAIDEQSSVCGMKIPTESELIASVKEYLGTSQTQTDKSVRGFYDAVGGTLYQIFNK